jgi:hypothetical protein
LDKYSTENTPQSTKGYLQFGMPPGILVMLTLKSSCPVELKITAPFILGALSRKQPAYSFASAWAIEAVVVGLADPCPTG